MKAIATKHEGELMLQMKIQCFTHFMLRHSLLPRDLSLPARLKNGILEQISMIVHCGIFKALIKDLAAIHPLPIGIIVLQGNVPPQSRIGGSSMGFQVRFSIKALHRNDNDRRPPSFNYNIVLCHLMLCRVVGEGIAETILSHLATPSTALYGKGATLAARPR